MTRATWKIYSADGDYEAEAVHGELAAAVVAVLGDGATVRTAGGHVVWREGAEEFPAGESYDGVVITIADRVRSGEDAPELYTGPPREGVDRCDCGAKYWNGTTCVSCGEEFKR